MKTILILLFFIVGCYPYKADNMYECIWLTYVSSHKIENGYEAIMTAGAIPYKVFFKDTTGFNLHAGKAVQLVIKL